MRQPVKTPNRNYRPGSFPKRGSRNTLALLVELQQKVDIGSRIKWLRDNSAESSRTIARYCDVSDEAVRNWIAGRGISWDNATTVAELFKVDVGWLWRGSGQAPPGYPVEDAEDVDSETPDPFAGPYAKQLDRIEEKLDEILRKLSPPAEDADESADAGDSTDEPDQIPESLDGDEPSTQEEDEQQTG